MEYDNLKSLTHHPRITPPTLKTLTQFLLSISVFTFIYCSSWCCFMLNSLTYYLSAFTFHGLDKRWIFLACNGILMVVATTSAGLVSAPSKGFDLNDMTENHVTADGLRTPEEPKDVEWVAVPIPNAVSQVEEEENDQETLEVEDQGSQDDQCFEGEWGGDHLILIEEDHVEQELVSHERLKRLEEPGESTEAEAEEIRTYHVVEETLHQENEEDLEAAGFLLGEDVQVEEEEEEEEGEEHGMEKLSAEELNKKFDDFIRKMKEELRIEAQQQLVVMVK